MEFIRHIDIKGKNKRIFIGLLSDGENYFFIQKTRTLTDFKKRIIVKTENVYSVETFFVLSECFSKFTNDSEITNKILLSEISKFNQFKQR